MRLAVTKLLVLLFIITLFFSCRIKSGDAKDGIAEGTRDGYNLAKYYCGNCHGFIPATALDSTAWATTVLPNMAQRLGIEVLWGKEYLDRGGNTSGIIFRDWKKIVAYYTKSAPKKIVIPPPASPIALDSVSFIIKQPSTLSKENVRTELTAIDPVSKKIFTSDPSFPYLYEWNNKLELTDSIEVYAAAVAATFFDDPKNGRQGVFTTKGNVFTGPNMNGKILKFDLDKKLGKANDTIATSLPRPLQTASSDFNHDGLMDWVTCGTGESRGGVFLLQQTSKGGYDKIMLTDSLGAIRLVADDFNKDGWADIMVTFAYNDESIRLFVNDKKGSFTETKLFGFSPLYGLTDLHTADFNKDGLTDIIYTCGSTYSLSQTPQPYHGVYVYLNKGDNRFEQAFFYQMSGCLKAVAADIDADGYLDIAAIALNTGIGKDARSAFVWLKQDSALHFQAFSPALGKYGRWLTMDVNDYDGDGDQDVILGNYYTDALSVTPSKPQPDKGGLPAPVDQHTPFTILENTKF